MIRNGTYSIIALDKKRNEMGIGVQSHWFSVGSIATWAESSAGVVASQAFADPRYGYMGIKLMSEGIPAKETLEFLLSQDKSPESRQVAMIDKKGNVATHTGKKCLPEAGHITGENYSVQGNILSSKNVWKEMASQFEKSDGELADRILAALFAGQRAGGDARGMQSAAILVVRFEKSEKPWNDKIVDLRVEDSKEPLKEMARLLAVHKAYRHASNFDNLIAIGKMEEAMLEYKKAFELAPENEELRFWYAVGLLNSKKVDEGLKELKVVYETNPSLAKLAEKLPDFGMLKVEKSVIRKAFQK